MAGKVKNQTRVSSKHQVTIPAGAFRTAGFEPGDVLKVEAEGAGRVVLTRVADAAVRDVVGGHRMLVAGDRQIAKVSGLSCTVRLLG